MRPTGEDAGLPYGVVRKVPGGLKDHVKGVAASLAANLYDCICSPPFYKSTRISQLQTASAFADSGTIPRNSMFMTFEFKAPLRKKGQTSLRAPCPHSFIAVSLFEIYFSTANHSNHPLFNRRLSFGVCGEGDSQPNRNQHRSLETFSCKFELIRGWSALNTVIALFPVDSRCHVSEKTMKVCLPLDEHILFAYKLSSDADSLSLSTKSTIEMPVEELLALHGPSSMFRHLMEFSKRPSSSLTRIRR